MEEKEDITPENDSSDENNEGIEPEEEYFIRLRKSKYNKIVFGACGGLGEYFSIDPVFFRMLFLLGIIIGGWGIIAYLITALLIPANHEAAEIEEAELEKIKASNNISVIAGIIVLAGLYVFLDNLGYFEFLSSIGIPSGFIAILILAVIVFFLFSLNTTAKDETIPKERFLRNRKEALFGGICSGLAEYIDVSPATVRLAAVILSFLTLGIPIFIYLFFMAIVPKEENV